MAGKDKKKASKKEQRELEKQRRIAMGQNSAQIKQQPKEAPKPMPKRSDTKEIPEAKINKITYDSFTLRVHTLSPLHLGSGQADVNVDAEVVHDEVGLPYFPAKRLKGLLYESALEVTEMNTPLGNGAKLREELDDLFHHGSQGEARLIIPSLYLEGHKEMKEDWQYLQSAYPEIFTVNDVLEQYTSLRYQTRLDRKTGTATDGSLHNMRVVEANLDFEGKIEVIGGTERHFKLLALAFKNLTQAGVKRTRGFGSIDCMMLQKGKDIRTALIKDVFEEGKNR